MSKISIVRGIGINDADYTVKVAQEDGSVVWCPYYRVWFNIINRVGLKRSYEHVFIYDPWKTFTVFKDWMAHQDWVGKDIDKDLLGDGSLYAPHTCIFIPHSLNMLLSKCGRPNTEGYVGFRRIRDKYVARIRVDGSEKYLGAYNTPHEAGRAYKQALADKLEPFLDELPEHAKAKLIIRIANLRKE